MFFRAQKQADVTDAIALGLLAGWDVQGTIRDGNFYAWLEGGTTDAHQLLDAVLERPLARSVLLDPEARQIAIGAALGAKGHGLGALITTYEFFRSNDGELASKKLLERIVRERRGRGLPPPKMIEDARALGRATQTIKKGGSPNEALERLAREAGLQQGRGVVAHVYELVDIDRVPLPADF